MSDASRKSDILPQVWIGQTLHLKTINMTRISLLFLVGILIAPLTILAQNSSPLPTGTSAEVWAGNTLYVSGSLDPDIKSHPTTESQTVGLLNDLKKRLESQGLTLGNVVMMHVYLGGDPAKDGKMDFEGMMAGYTQFFGTRDQPNKPARTTVQVVLPAGARGGLIEIDLIAVRTK